MRVTELATIAIAGSATIGVIARPWRLPEAIWAAGGALLLVLTGLLPVSRTLIGISKGFDVYLFLIGMMLLAEVAGRQGLFDWLAHHAVTYARGSPRRLFSLIYAVGTVVTVFLSNDATAVVLTPAVYAVAKVARAEPLPYLLICAFIANAASFVLPISNPANLVVFAHHLPGLPHWLARFALPSALAIVATYATLRFTQRHTLCGEIAAEVEAAPLGAGGPIAAVGIVTTILLLLIASSLQLRLGLPTCLAALATVGLVMTRTRETPWSYLRPLSWSILPLVAGLFVLVEALGTVGLLRHISEALQALAREAPAQAPWVAGILTALIANLANNLPTGLVAGAAIHAAQSPRQIAAAVVIGVDLGPNLSVTGSLATILWLAALRREGQSVSALAFLRIGCIVMPVALLLALAGLAIAT